MLLCVDQTKAHENVKIGTYLQSDLSRITGLYMKGKTITGNCSDPVLLVTVIFQWNTLSGRERS